MTLNMPSQLRHCSKSISKIRLSNRDPAQRRTAALHQRSLMCRKCAYEEGTKVANRLSAGALDCYIQRLTHGNTPFALVNRCPAASMLGSHS